MAALSVAPSVVFVAQIISAGFECGMVSVLTPPNVVTQMVNGLVNS